MKITRTRVQNYKLVMDSGWIDIDRAVTTLIGKNESGKTSILEALSFFGESGVCEEENINTNARSRNTRIFPIISIEIEPDEDDPAGYQQLAEETSDNGRVVFTKNADGSRMIKNWTAGDTNWERAQYKNMAEEKIGELRDELISEISESEEYVEALPDVSDVYHNNLSEVSSRIRNSMNDLANNFSPDGENENIITETRESLKEIRREVQQGNNQTQDIFSGLPRIVYHKDIKLIEDGIELDEIASGEHQVIKMFLDRQGVEYSPDSDQDTHRELLRAGREASNLVNNWWSQKSVAITTAISGEGTFRVLVRDTSLQRMGTSGSASMQESIEQRDDIKPSKRSRGFQWFLSFCLSLVPGNNPDTSDRVILLDDPAVYLHPEGKNNWLDAIDRLSDQCQVVYSTHSPFLIDKRYSERIRIVEDKGDETGTKVTSDFVEAEGIALEPVRNALGVWLGNLPFVSDRRLIVEGVVDHYIITAVGYYCRDYEDNEILEMDGLPIAYAGSASETTIEGQWAASENFEYAILLDNDTAGREAKEKIRKHHREIDIDRVLLLENDNVNNPEKLEIEDMFSPEFYLDCVNEVYEQYGEFTQIPLDISDETVLIDREEYTGEDIVSKIEQALNSQGMDPELRKRAVAEEAKKRLDSNQDVSSEDIQAFKPLLAQLNTKTQI